MKRDFGITGFRRERHFTMSKPTRTSLVLTPDQQVLNDLWEEHNREEFQSHDTDATIDSMVPDAYVGSWAKMGVGL
jgi:hypothetical protein